MIEADSKAIWNLPFFVQILLLQQHFAFRLLRLYTHYNIIDRQISNAQRKQKHTFPIKSRGENYTFPIKTRAENYTFPTKIGVENHTFPKKAGF